MGFRFRKRICLAKGVYWNLGKKGSSFSIGGRGHRECKQESPPGYVLGEAGERVHAKGGAIENHDH
jgi:Protein of unknown function (DUF4236)